MKRTHLWYNGQDDEYFASHSGFAREQGSEWRNVSSDVLHSERAVFFGEWIGSAPIPRELNIKGTEHGEQTALFCWMAAMARVFPAWAGGLAFAFAVPNGGARDRATASMLKAEGVRSGVPDVMIPITNQHYAGLFIELKVIKGGTLSDEQARYLAFLNEQRYRAVRCNGYAAARKTIIEYMGWQNREGP